MPIHISKTAEARRSELRRKTLRRRFALGAFMVGALVVLGVSASLVVKPLRAHHEPAQAPAATGKQYRIVVTMAGCDPSVLRVRAGEPFTVHLLNPDSRFHTDGGGWHQFHIETLGIDVRIPPQSERSQTFAGLAPGTYEFYCDVCCGGKENPTMRGVIEVTG
ncbi:MAG: cupredoxin domain-containing protein [Armatimonadota bacterium]|nr:cupredoxin domain-containing protein [Armatimonadota bacterium]